MLSIIQNIQNVNTYPLTYVFKHMKLQHKKRCKKNLHTI